MFISYIFFTDINFLNG